MSNVELLFRNAKALLPPAEAGGSHQTRDVEIMLKSIPSGAKAPWFWSVYVRAEAHALQGLKPMPFVEEV